MTQNITPNLWFNNNAKEAIDFYLSVFKDAKILQTDYYTEVGEDITGHKKGDLLTIEFELLGTHFIAINAGPEFHFNPSVSFSVECKTQEEIDYYWEKLSSVPQAEQCGWLQDKYGLSWQIVPKDLAELLKQGTEEQRKRVFEVFMPMKKVIIADLEKAYKGNA
ncbi:MAG TPA: VOC family protein [Candidatus Sulfotelmatobacter sp.]|jgi:predicted 3-demethylubiquinone-9 3-methyltransferase (glyoxalase superfamily)|nr:VOC family protein [Candidatus Sulfotelmatobacter sp.]